LVFFFSMNPPVPERSIRRKPLFRSELLEFFDLAR